MNNQTAIIVNSCFDGKMSFRHYIKVVLGLFRENIKDLVILSLLAQLPIMVLAISGLPAIVIQIVGAIVQIIFTVSVLKLIDNRSKGNMISAIQAIKLFKENWIQASGVILFQSLLLGFGNIIPFLGILMNVFLAVSIPMGVLENRSIMDSVVSSFKLVKEQIIDVFAKLFILSAITSVILMVLKLFLIKVPSALMIVNIVISVLMIIPMIAGIVLFYNLPTVKNN